MSSAPVRLRQLARASSAEREQELEHCELCGEVIPSAHRHLLDLESKEIMCACQACKILFDRKAAGGSHYRLIPDRRLSVPDFVLDDVGWAKLRIPVEMAFFFRNSEAERVDAFYPSPAGATQSLLEFEAWDEIERDNPLLTTLEPDVEALLVNRARGSREHFVVPIDDCYRLVGLIRTRWRGLSGGEEVWKEIAAFFEDLSKRAKTVTTDKEEATA
jgi:hypothetical protein